MNELERLIASLSRPEPGATLDQRIDALLALPPVRPAARRWKNLLAWTATAACVGVIGFYLGRQSAIPPAPQPAPPQPMMAAAPATNPPAELAPRAPKVTNFPLAENQLADFFVRPASREGMFGNAPVKFEILSSH